MLERCQCNVQLCKTEDDDNEEKDEEEINPEKKKKVKRLNRKKIQ